jgi:flagellar biosynthesis/type III secretory pathway protein FliH
VEEEEEEGGGGGGIGRRGEEGRKEGRKEGRREGRKEGRADLQNFKSMNRIDFKTQVESSNEIVFIKHMSLLVSI